MEFRVAKFGHERSVDECVDVWKDLAHALVREDFFVCESGVAPYVLAGLLLDAAGKLCKGLDLVERVAAGECDVGKFIGLDDLQKLIYGHFPAPMKIPGLRVMTARTMMRASRTVYRCTESRPIGHRLLQYVQNPYFHSGVYLITIQSFTTSPCRQKGSTEEI